MSSVDDPEKHFLGNLLEDDPGSPSTAPPFSRNRSNETSSAASTVALPQLANVGPVMRPIAGSDMSHAWPEPPPPYSPPLESWGLTSNANMTLVSPPGPLTTSSWFPGSEHKETTTAADILGVFGALNGSSSSTAPASPARALPSSPQVHHFHHNLHHHTHTHNVQVQNHYFGTPPPGLEAYGPRPTATASASSSSPTSQQRVASSTIPRYDSMTTSSSLFDYTGLAEINTSSNSLLFSDWKNKNMCQASPEPTVSSGSSISLKSLREEPEKEPVHLPLSPKEVVEVAMEKKNVSKSYADHLSKTTAAAVALTSPAKKGTPIGAEKKQKQELAKKMSSQTIGESAVTRIVVKGQPHSAPVVSKMPFSYRDVAARVEHNSGSNHAIPQNEEIVAQQERKETVSTETSKTSETKAVQTKTSETNKEGTDESKKIESSGRKSRADNEFQKINNRKNKRDQKSQNGVPAAPLVYDPVHPVDASSRYDVLKNLESLPAQRVNAGKKNVSGRPPLIQAVYSRSSSPADDLEDTEGEETTRARSASNHAHLNGNSNMKKEQKKRVVQANQRRRKGRKTEPTWFDNLLTGFGDFLLLAWSYIVHMFQWTFELIVDVCVKIYDVVLCSCECLYIGAWRGVRKVFMVLIGCFYHLMVWCKQSAFVISSFTIINVLGFKPEEEDDDEEMELDWGCKKELPIPTSPTEYADRLSRETICDAYSVFGLKSDCSDDDIKRNYKRLVALVSPDKCQIETAEEVYALVNIAFEAIGNQESRADYIVENAKENETHSKLVKQWKEMTARVEEVRNTINCDCSKRHLRIATNIAPSQARYCKRCTIKHPAKQNDIWVEKRHLGLTSVYLTCTDNVVYDITEWATCESQRAMLKNMRAHTHHVQYRLLSPLTAEFDSPSSFFNSAMNYSSSTTDARFLNDLEEYSSMLRQRSLAQISFKTCEPREEDRSRRAANRRQKRWR